MNNTPFAVFSGLALLVVIQGCGLSRPYPEKAMYTIHVSAAPAREQIPTTAPSAPSIPSAHVLLVEALRVAAPYNGNTFYYKVGKDKFTSDYYNIFFTTPSRILTGDLIEWLSASTVFSRVVDGSNGVDHTLTLEGEVTELYGDYSDPKSFKAVIAARFFLIQDRDIAVTMANQMSYRVEQPITSNDPDALVQGWNQAYQQILEKLTSDLRTTRLPQLK